MHYLDYMTFLDIPCYFTLCSRVLVIIVIMWHDNYLSRIFHVHYIYVTPCMHDFIVHDLSSRFFLLLLSLSVLNNTNHIVLTISIPYLCYYYIFFIFFFYCPSCTFVGQLLMDLYYFSIFRSDSRYRGLIVEHSGSVVLRWV